jgi:hypothetical protein
MDVRKRIGLIALAVATTIALVTTGAAPASAAPVKPQAGNLAHISPWDNSACNTNVQAGSGTTVYYEYYDSSRGTLVDHSLGTAQYRYSPNGSCSGYQWIHFVLNMTAVHTYMGSNDPSFSFDLWLDSSGASYVPMTVTFTGGQADGDFQSYAVKAGAGKTDSKLLDSSSAPAYYNEASIFFNPSNSAGIWLG